MHQRGRRRDVDVSPGTHHGLAGGRLDRSRLGCGGRGAHDGCCGTDHVGRGGHDGGPEIVEAAPATELTSDGVLAAAVIIVSGGDLESAISDCVVTEAEAAAALAALENGTLSDYQD